MKTIVMTGVTSFLGINVLKKLLKEECKIYALVRENSKSREKLPKDDKISYIEGSLDTIDIIGEYVDNADVFIHFAWDGSGKVGRADSCIQNRNVDYGMCALRLAENLGCKKFIFSGSQAEYGESLLGDSLIPVNEDVICNPVSEYGKAKSRFAKAALEYCNDKAMQFIHMRIFSVYGADDREGTLIDMCLKYFGDNGCVEVGPCRQLWNYLYIDDFTEIVKAFVEQECKTGIYNVAGTDTKILKDFIEEMRAVVGAGRVIYGKEDNNPEKSPNLNPDIKKFTTVLGLKPQISFKEGIERILQVMDKEDWV